MFWLYAKQGPFSAKLSTIKDSILDMLKFQANWLMLHNPPNKGAITKSNKIPEVLQAVESQEYSDEEQRQRQ